MQDERGDEIADAIDRLHAGGARGAAAGRGSDGTLPAPRRARGHARGSMRRLGVDRLTGVRPLLVPAPAPVVLYGARGRRSFGGKACA